MTAVLPTSEIHDGWLHLEQMMIERHGSNFAPHIKRGMQSAYYMGAMTSLVAEAPHQHLFKQAESGLADALGEPNLRIQKVKK